MISETGFCVFFYLLVGITDCGDIEEFQKEKASAAGDGIVGL